jgi:hypothetical protein
MQRFFWFFFYKLRNSDKEQDCSKPGLWSRSRNEFLDGVEVGVGKNVPTPTPTSV